MDFTNREISTYLWLFGFICWFMRNGGVRDAACALIRAFFQWKILSVYIASYVYISACVYALSLFGIWTSANIKTTVIWAFCYTFRTLIKANSVLEDEAFFSKTVRDLFALTGILTFVVEFHSFSLTVELIAIPLLTFIAICHAFAGFKNEHKQVEKLLGGLLFLVGIFYISYSCYLSFVDIKTFASVETLREFCNPILLTLAFLPFLYLLGLLFAYEQVFAILKFAIKNDQLRYSAQWRALFTFRLDVNALQRWARAVVRFRPQSDTELHNLFTEAREMEIREANPSIIDRSQGWSPYAAMDFLTREGLRTRDYFRSFENEWSACSDYLDADSGILPNKISYYLNGTDLAVTELELVLDVSNPSESSSAETRFIEIAKVLLLKALEDRDASSAITNLEQLRDFNQETPYESVSLTRTIWSGGIEGGYSRTLTIKSASHRVFEGV